MQKSLLAKRWVKGESLLAAAHTVWLNAQYEPDSHNLELLLSPISDIADEIDTIERFKDYAARIIDYANSVPKWLLKGHTADETDLMVYSADDAYLEELYGAELSESENEEIMRFFDKVNKVRPVAPDDPCPCGSGLSYRFCHGRHYS